MYLCWVVKFTLDKLNGKLEEKNRRSTLTTGSNKLERFGNEFIDRGMDGCGSSSTIQLGTSVHDLEC